MSETTHTPLPWKMAERFVEDFVIRGANDAAVAYAIGRTSHVRLDPEANARLIVTAVNHHAALVEALREAREMLRQDYPDASLKAGNWPTVRPIAQRWDALLARIEEGA